jgi:hypothetical protein
MARTRQIKPGFFQNEDLAALPPLVRLIFVGSWTVADYKGCFEWRPTRLKVQLAPYDRVNLDAIFDQLRDAGFVRRYTLGNQKFIKIVNFVKHQNPHKQEREAGSEIPDIDTSGAHETRSKVRSRRKICTQSAQKSVESEINLKSSEIENLQTHTNKGDTASNFGSTSESNVPLTSNLKPLTVNTERAADAAPTPDPRRSHPAIVALQETVGVYPPKEIWDELIDQMGSNIDLVKLKTVYRKWRARGYNKTNYDGIIDWYLNGIPPQGKSNGTNRKHNETRATSTDRLEQYGDFSEYESEADLGRIA